MPILLDYSQVAHAAVMVFYNELENSPPEVVQNIIRHATLSSIKNYKKTYGRTYGEMIIACDNKDIWRKDHFPLYKYKRQKDKEESSLDWDFIFKCINDLREDLKNYFPYRVIHVDRCEGDDVIGVLARYIQESEAEGLFSEPPKILIISSDKDYKQLHDIPSLVQFAPAQKKWVERVPSAQESLYELIATGDSGDGVPSVLSPDNVFKDKIRQKPLRQGRKDEFIKFGRDACQTDDERKHWDRNQKMIDFSYIPEEFRNNIIRAYTEYVIVKDKMRTMHYLNAHDCNLLVNDLQDF